MKSFYVTIGLFFSLPFLAQVNLSNSLSACYALDGNANEPINGLTGILTAVTPTVDRNNNPNSAFFFDGAQYSRISLPNNQLIKPNAISGSCWVLLNNATYSQELIFAHNSCMSYHEGYQLSFENQWYGVGFQICKANSSCSPSGQIRALSTAPVLPNTWYHIGFYAGPDSLKIYVNGTLSAVTANTNPLVYDAGAQVYLGGTNLAFDFPLTGCMDNVRLYNRKLNDAEMYQLYAQDPACISGPVPVTSFSVSAQSVCVNQPVTLTDVSSNNPSSWNWQMPGAMPAGSTASSSVVSFTAAGNYTVSLTASNNFGAGNNSVQTVTVFPLPQVVALASKTLVCRGDAVTLIAGGASTYLWSGGQTVPSLVVSPVATTVYSVTGTDVNGCQNSASVTVAVSICQSLHEDNPEETIMLYPNPAGSICTVVNPQAQACKIRAINSLGEIVFETEVGANGSKIMDVTDLPKGMYFLHWQTDVVRHVKKLVKN